MFSIQAEAMLSLTLIFTAVLAPKYTSGGRAFPGPRNSGPAQSVVDSRLPWNLVGKGHIRGSDYGMELRLGYGDERSGD